jgi:hypothetical protein
MSRSNVDRQPDVAPVFTPENFVILQRAVTFEVWLAESRNDLERCRELLLLKDALHDMRRLYTGADS